MIEVHALCADSVVDMLSHQASSTFEEGETLASIASFLGLEILETG